jgi:hypothetical protein
MAKFAADFWIQGYPAATQQKARTGDTVRAFYERA